MKFLISEKLKNSSSDIPNPEQIFAKVNVRGALIPRSISLSPLLRFHFGMLVVPFLVYIVFSMK